MKKNIIAIAALTMVLSATALTGCTQNAAQTGEQTEVTTQVQEADASSVDENKKAVLVVSFGTSYNESREKTIGAVEEKVAQAFPDYDQKRAFTSQTIIDKLADRDNEIIDNVTQAMDKLVQEGYGSVVIQPTHVMNGKEYDEMKELTAPYEDKLSIKYGKPLLTSSEDYEELANGIISETPQVSEEGTAVVLMGHGTEHFANSAYAALDYRFKAMGYDNVFVGTVEGYPDLDKIKTDLAKLNPKKVVLLPLMIVAGDHATNDMAGDEEDSWKTQLKKEGYEVECVLKGLGEYTEIQDMFVEHCEDAMTTEE